MLTVSVYMLNTRCILLLGQPSDDCYAHNLLDVFAGLSIHNDKLYREDSPLTSRAPDKPGPAMHRTRSSEEPSFGGHTLASLPLNVGAASNLPGHTFPCV